MGVYHISNWGSYGTNIPHDRKGQARTSIKDVLAGDYGGYKPTKDEAAEIAAETRQAISEADKRVNRWRSGKG